MARYYNKLHRVCTLWECGGPGTLCRTDVLSNVEVPTHRNASIRQKQNCLIGLYPVQVATNKKNKYVE